MEGLSWWLEAADTRTGDGDLLSFSTDEVVVDGLPFSSSPPKTPLGFSPVADENGDEPFDGFKMVSPIGSDPADKTDFGDPFTCSEID